MAIASGTCGTCTWTISDAGVLTVRPTSGSSGNLNAGSLGVHAKDWPWHNYRSQIVRIVLSGNITTSYTLFSSTTTGVYTEIFANCTNLTSISGIGSLKGATDCQSMFNNCGQIEEINISSLDTSAVTNMEYMFSNCTSLKNLVLSGINTSNVKNFYGFISNCTSLSSIDLSNLNTTKGRNKLNFFFYRTSLLSSVTFGSQFYIKPESQSSVGEYGYDTDFGSGRNLSNGIVVDSSITFSELTNEERAGTWERNVNSSYNVTAARVSGGVADEDGEDVAITARWATQAETTDRTLKVYKKISSASTYPSTPAITQQLSGNSGVTTVTITDVGDDAYDFKVEFYDGTNTYIAFPSVQSNIRLVTIDSTGNVCLYFDTTASSGTTDAKLYEAITALGWQNDVII